MLIKALENNQLPMRPLTKGRLQCGNLTPNERVVLHLLQAQSIRRVQPEHLPQQVYRLAAHLQIDVVKGPQGRIVEPLARQHEQ